MIRTSTRTPSALVALCALALPLTGQSRTYTTDADFEEGLLVNVNYEPPGSDQLQLGVAQALSSVLSVACGGTGTIVRIDTRTGEVLGEYRTAPNNYDRDPSRATVDLEGNVWAGNRLEGGAAGAIFGSVVKVGVVLGGTRVNADGTPNPNGRFLAPPFEYSTAVDRDGDGLIATSRGLGDVLSWPGNGDDGLGGSDARVEDAKDECILVFQRTTAPRVRHISVDPDGNVWAGGYPSVPTSFDLLDGVTGARLANVPAAPPGCGGYAGLVDGTGTLWSSSELEDAVYRRDAGGAASCIPVQPSPRGLALTLGGEVVCAGGNRIAFLSPDGLDVTILPVRDAADLHGVAVHPADGSIWLASSGNDRVLRLDPDGNLLATIPVAFGGAQGDLPRGVAIDGDGFVWVANQGSDDLMRIDPLIDAVDLRVPLQPGAAPYDPSDMTGEALRTTLLTRGQWTVVTDGGAAGTPWSSVRWSADTPGESSLAVFVRAADALGDLAGLPWQEVANTAPFDLPGRYLETRVEFDRGVPGGPSPVLFDLTVAAGAPCLEANRRRGGSLLLYPEFDNQAASWTVLTVTNTDSEGGPLDVEFVYIDGDSCEEFNRVERLTPDDTLTLVTRFHDPDQVRGYVYAFARDPGTGEPAVANSLIGSTLVISGLDGAASLGSLEYAVNAVPFEGIGDGTRTDLDGDGIRDLDGVEYAAAPDRILIPRFLGQQDAEGPLVPIRSQLVLVALTGGARFDTTLDLLVMNDDEQVFSTQHTFHCWDKVDLLEISNLFRADYLRDYTADDPAEPLGAPAIETGWMRIDGGVARSITTDLDDPAFYAVLIERLGQGGGADLPFEQCSQPNGKLLPRSLTGE
jgi:hypothetical protein